MKKCFLFFVFFNAVSIPNIYASCYDISSCSKELSDIENSKSSNATCSRVTKDCFLPGCNLCDRIFYGINSSGIANLQSNGYTKVFENCYGGVWCKDKPVERKSSYSTNSNSSYSANSYSSSYNNDSSSDDDDSDLYFRSLSEKKGVYEIYKDNIDVGYYGNISYGYPDGNGNIFYYDDLVYSGAFKLGTPSGTGVLFSKNGYLYGTWTYGVFKQQKIMSANLLPITVNISGKSQKLANKMLYVKLYELDANSSQGKLLLKRFNRSCRSYY